VLSDVLDGYTTVELADRNYGVVIDAQARTIDLEATRRLRERARADAAARAT
jgi:5-oxoprolinase (ATP-hydrolysing)